MFKSWPRTGLVVVGAALAVLAFASLAIGAFREKSKRITVNGGAEPSATVKCPRGTEAVSGGFLGTSFNETAVQRMERVTPRKVRLRFENRTPTRVRAKASALCSHPRLGLRKESITGTVGDGDSLTATCPSGMKAVSGGVSIPESAVLFVDSFKRDRHNKWTASFNTEGGPTPGVKVSVLCDDHPGRIREVAKTRTIPGGAHRSITARCRRHETVVSGGWEGEINIASFVLVEVFGSIRDGRRAWTSSADSVTANPGSFTTFAYCLRR
jgi:hypothetical protein